MNLIRWSLPAAVALLLAVTGSRAQAQTVYQRPITNPYGTPAFSPYLNLNRFGTNPAINYYGIVRPEIQTSQALRSLRNDVNANSTAISQDQLNGLPVTGHPVQFLNTSHYFLNTNPGGGQRQGSSTTTPSFAVGAKPQQGAALPKR